MVHECSTACEPGISEPTTVTNWDLAVIGPAQGDDAAKLVAPDGGGQVLELGREAYRVGNHEEDPGVGSQGGVTLSLGAGYRERFLAQHGDTGRCGHLDELTVAGVLGADDDSVGFPGEELLIGVDVADSQVIG